MSTKPVLDLEDAYEDFGFSAVSEDELKEIERELAQKVREQEKTLTLTSREYKDKLEALYKLIMPLLINLQKEPEKTHLYWPNRSEKISQLISKIDKVYE